MSFPTHNWMNFVSSRKKLSDLTIPGTHDSGTWKLSGLYHCQDRSLGEQLQAGIRFLDIRLKPSGKADELEVWHAGGNAHLNFRNDIVGVCRDFLAKNPSETIIMSIKDESQTYVRKEAFYNRLHDDMLSFGHLFFLQPKIPVLGEVRGRIVLLRRCWANASEGIDVTGGWPDGGNYKNGKHSWTNAADIPFTVQDKYSGFLSVRRGDKFNDHVLPLLNEAANNADRLYINFTSAVLDGGGSLPAPPRLLAEATNRLLLAYLNNKPQARYGIIAMDFPELEPELIKKLIECNYQDPAFLPRMTNRKGDRVLLRFDGGLHALLNPRYGHRLWGGNWNWQDWANLGCPLEAPNMVESHLVKTLPGGELYLAYNGTNGKAVIRRIVSAEMQDLYGFQGKPDEIKEVYIRQFEKGPALTLGGHAFMEDFRVRNRMDNKQYLVFDGQLHHIPGPDIAGRLLGKDPCWFREWAFVAGKEQEGLPLTDARLLKFDDSAQVYLSYTLPGQTQPVLRAIPNPDMQQAWGLWGEPEEKPAKEKAVNYNEQTLLSHSRQPAGAPANQDIVEIRSMLDIDKCLDIAANGTDIVIRSVNGTPGQRWKLTDAGDGYHYLESQAGQDKVLDVKAGGTGNGTGIIAFQRNRCDNQQWKILPAPHAPGLYYLAPKHAPGCCLDLGGFKTRDGAALILHKQKDDRDRANQVWYFHKVNG
ncbi:phosphatidylinositol-specific phospholipase C domain-containing protein [Taibaiella chishuiensis]|uniref:1-phosphatidylinositol phosphodiesterase n=1 Tax=Taibaiella chishuiensis TaxID=1434707 RepID=A0A2P8D771_9BACT|nr:phosphatidylinositol-specific phospholipase C domain-containing protein [Taibaiella chishuiensis]PSK93039.1 phosphatidylinositol-specific phospholipase C-like protein [Taibaiella chishuiensis]